MFTRNNQPSRSLRGIIPALALLLCGFALLASSALQATARPSPFTGYAPLATPTAVPDAFLVFVPEPGGPPNGGGVSVGTTFTLDLMLNAGSNADPDGVTAQQSYLTYTYPLL